MRALSPKLGALRERDVRLLFTATTIAPLGDRIASIALVFAVLAIGSATQLGLVLGARSLAEAAILLFGGVLSDRLPRNLVLVGASLVQGAAQAGSRSWDPSRPRSAASRRSGSRSGSCS
jgi:hypothetical protein